MVGQRLEREVLLAKQYPLERRIVCLLYNTITVVSSQLLMRSIRWVMPHMKCTGKQENVIQIDNSQYLPLVRTANKRLGWKDWVGKMAHTLQPTQDLYHLFIEMVVLKWHHCMKTALRVWGGFWKHIELLKTTGQEILSPYYV